MAQVLTVGKYLARQAKCIKLFGEKTVERQGVTKEILDDIQPFRRLSKKKGSLSDPEYFIKHFEKETGSRFLPENWSSLSVEDKVDYIVKDRYQKLVSNKIMGKIKDKPEEHLFKLNKDGDIAYYSKGSQGFCGGEDELKVADAISIHNHPGYMKTEYSEDEVKYIQKHFPERLKGVTPFSDSDIAESLRNREKAAYVIDSQGHKFLYKRRQDIHDIKENTKNGIKMELEIDDLGKEAFPDSEVYNLGIRKANKLLEDLETYDAKQKKFGKLLFPDFIRKKKIDKWLRAKTDALSMEPFNKINKGMKEICEKFGHYYEQLS